MYEGIKTRAQQAKQFVSDHPTISACAATSLITWKMTRDSVIKDTAGVVYAAGHIVGELEVQRNILLDYVAAKGLSEDVREYIISMRS